MLDNNETCKSSAFKVDVLAVENELNHQAKEASRLQQELNSARDNIQKTGQVISDSLHRSVYRNAELSQLSATSLQSIEQFGKSNANNNNSVFKPSSLPTFPSNEVTLLTNTKIHLENALENSQVQNV